MAIEIVDLPIYPLKIVIFHSYVSLPKGTWLIYCFVGDDYKMILYSPKFILGYLPISRIGCGFPLIVSLGDQAATTGKSNNHDMRM